MAASIDTVLFDLDETLCEPRLSCEERLARAYETVGVEPIFPPDAYFAIAEEYMTAAEEKAERRALCFEDLVAERGHERGLGRTVADAYAELTDYSDVRPLPGALEALETCRDGHRVGLVTNGERGMQDPKIEALDCGHHFETRVYAGIDTAPKPDPEPFAVALATMGSEPDETVVVGNSLDSDVLGGNRAGCTTVYLDRDDASPEDRSVEAVGPDYIVESMDAVGPSLWA